MLTKREYDAYCGASSNLRITPKDTEVFELARCMQMVAVRRCNTAIKPLGDFNLLSLQLILVKGEGLSACTRFCPLYQKIHYA